jgi:signal transduction histidine kinase/response regulator RpfG family c-di-GMP phosphodiesterase
LENKKKQLFTAQTAAAIKIIIFAIVIILTIFLVFVIAIPDVSKERNADIRRGEKIIGADSGADWDKGLFLLNGEWELYPNLLLNSADFAAGNAPAADYVSFPHYWRDDVANFPDGRGFATYRLVVRTPVEKDGVGIYSDFQPGAYRIYINGVLVGSGGNVSENVDEYYFAFNGSHGYITETTDYYEVIVQIQSYDHVNAGLANDIVLGSTAAVLGYTTFVKGLAALMMGALLVLTFYFFLLFVRNTEKKEYFNYAVVAFCGLFMVLANSGDNFIYLLVPALSGRLLYACEYITFIIGAYALSMHIIQKYVKFKHINTIGTILTTANCILAAVLTPYMVSTVRLFFIITSAAFILTAVLLSLFNLIRADKKSDVLVLEFIGLMVLVAGLVARFTFPQWAGLDAFSISVLFFSFIQVFVLSAYYRKVDDDLLDLTKTLENRIEERTAALVESNRKVEAADRVKSEFLTRMSREIRMPMNAIVSISELFDIENLNETQKNYFLDIKETSHTILNLINDIMDFSRIEAGRLELAPSHFCLNAFIENICATAKYSAHVKGLCFESVAAEGLPEVIYGDEVRMKQVIANIISNAVKYTREGVVKLSISTAAENEEKMLLFTVKDTGEGMHKKDLLHIFDAFMNPETGKKRGLKGTGLGMAICKKLMDMQQGRIDFDSVAGKGSEVKLYFPLTEGDANLVEHINVSEKIYAKNAKILIVEDNSINVTVALDIFAAHDIRSDVAKDGYKALSMIKEKDYDLVFMDQFLPGMDGIETTQRIREMGGKYKTLPIVAMTSNVVHGARDMLIFKGLSDYIAKPVDRNAFNNILIRWLPFDKINSALGRFNKTERSGTLNGLPMELIQITEIDCNAALKNMDGSVELFIGLLRRFTTEADNYAESLDEYLKAADFVNYIIVINGVKTLLYNIGARACGDMAARLAKAASEKNERFCLEKNDQFCEHLRWLSQRVLLALPQQDSDEIAESKEAQSELVKLAGIMHDLSFDYSIGDCDSIDKRITMLKDSSFGEDYDSIVFDIISETEVMEYEKAAQLCKNILNTLLNE